MLLLGNTCINAIVDCLTSKQSKGYSIVNISLINIVYFLETKHIDAVSVKDNGRQS